MSTTLDRLSSDTRRWESTWLQAIRHYLPLAVIVLLAAFLRLGNLSELGYVNHYYTAGTVSMLQSWQNFFFAAAEPGGAVSIDKPPVGLWLQAISARIFGVNTFGLLFPQILAGILSVILLNHLVGRRYGRAAGLLAALALAITPVVVAVDRNNTIDSTLIFTLLLAAWAFIKATESGKLRFLLLGAVLVGIGFNIKMLAAFLPLPAFYALYFLGAKVKLWRKFANLALASVLLVAVSLSWALIVDSIPADQRPYVGSSGTNSVINLMLGYNGTDRLLGRGGNSSLFGGGQQRGQGGFGGGQPGGGQSGGGQRDRGNTNQPQGQGGAPQGNNNSTNNTQSGQNRPQGGMQQGNGNGRGGGNFGGGVSGLDTGSAGLTRLFRTPLSKEASWLLPFGIFGAVLLLFRTRLRWPLASEHQDVVLWGGWLLIAGVFFSVAGFFHPYYTALLAPALSALVGIGAISLWKLYRTHGWLAIGLLCLAIAATLWLQIGTAQTYVSNAWWLSISLALAVIGVLALLIATFRRWPRIAQVGFSVAIAALLITPGVWAAETMQNPSSNQSLPSAYSGQESAPANNGGLEIDQGLLDYLQTNTQDITYLLAVPSSMQGSDYVIATERPVLYLGGFMGQDDVADSTKLAEMVANKQLRYVYWSTESGNGFGNGGSGQSDISSWLNSSCSVVDGYETVTTNSGAPRGTTRATVDDATGGMGGGRGMTLSLYDCGGA